MTKNIKTYHNLTLEDVEEIKKIILEGLKFSGENHETIIKIVKTIALDLHFYKIFRDFYNEIKTTESICFNCSKDRFKQLKKYSVKCDDWFISSALKCLSEF